MKKLPVRIYSLLLAVSFSVIGYANAANDKAFAWQVSTDRVTVYLIGSIHFADKSFYPLRQEIDSAFSRSDNLVVELDINSIDAGDYNRLLMQQGFYKDGTTIKDVISAKTWLKLQQRLHQLDINYDDVKYYRPGVLVLTLTTAQATQLGFDPQLGIDAHFLHQAKQQSKNIIGLETLEQQFNLFLTIPDGDLLLQESLYSLDESEAVMADMVRFWKQGDEKGMSKLLFEDAVKDYPAFAEVYEVLLYQRNRQMLSKIDAMLKQKVKEKTFYFVVVGSGHLIGDKGIVSALKEKGYNVKRF